MLPDRFWAKVVRTEIPPGCWFWVGALGDDGYGRWAESTTRTVAPHRAVWEDAHGAVPGGELLLHSCDETSCVRLEHLSTGTQEANQQQMARRRRGSNPWKRGLADTRGASGRARAIREALLERCDPGGLAEAMAAGDPRAGQLLLEFS